MKYLVLAIFLFPISSFAQYDPQFTRVPSGNETYQSVIYNVDLTAYLAGYGFTTITEFCDNNSPFIGSTYWTLGFTDSGNAAYLFDGQTDINQNTGIFSFITQPGQIFDVTQVVANCEGYFGSLASIEYNNGDPILTLDFNAVNPSTNIWGSNTGFWGDDFNAVNIKESLQASVQATGVSLWPLFYLLGVPLAFAIAYYLLDFVYYSIYMGQTSQITSRSAYLDKMMYRPYKGYNRLRSRKWNRENTAN